MTFPRLAAQAALRCSPLLAVVLVVTSAVGQVDGPVANLTQHPANDWGPMWSPDGDHIAFYSDRDGGTRLYVSDSDGTNARNVSQSPGDDRDAAWSPDGSRLAFVTGGDDGDIHVVGVDDGTQRVIAAHEAKDWGPAWASDGLRLAFLSNREGGSHIYVVDVDIDAPVRLTWGLAEHRQVAWSPDGAGLTFISHRYGQTDLYMYDANGENLRALTRQADVDSATAWAPDARRLAYVSRGEGNAEVYVVGVGDRQTRNVSQHAMVDSSPDWSPDGSQLAFMSNRDGNTDVYVMEGNAGELRNLTAHPQADGDPSWSPGGRQIAFATNRDGDWEIYVHTLQEEGAAWDVNDDGRIDIIDLVTVAQTFGMTGSGLAGDVTADGVVNILDLVLVASHFGEATTALAAPARMPRTTDANMIQGWLDEARGADDGSPAHRRGVQTLQRLLSMVRPDATALLRNYPNPFNPETWIPFRLSFEAEVAITVYDITGKTVREIDMGALAAGDYLTQGRAAHWDGRNLTGEAVGSGVYYVELRAGAYRAVDRLIVAK